MKPAIPERRPAIEEISGVIERVTFHNDDSGFCVLRVKTRGHREETTVVGSLPSVTCDRRKSNPRLWRSTQPTGTGPPCTHFCTQRVHKWKVHDF